MSDPSIESVRAKFEEGKPADPTENMTEEQRKEWWMHHEKNKDQFKQANEHLRSITGGQERASNLARLWRATQDPTVFRVRARTAAYSGQAIDFFLKHLAADETDTDAKFEEGKPADPTENMTEEQKKEWWKHHERNKDKFKGAAGGPDPRGRNWDQREPTWSKLAAEEVEEQKKEAAGGLYGYTKATQRDVEASVRKVEKQARRIAVALWDRDERVAAFVGVHARRANSIPARILSAAFEGLVSKKAGTEVQAGAAEYGLYGHHARTARLGLNACTELRDFAGRAAYDLHSRRQAAYGHITGFLREHTKAAKCRYSRLLLDSYPDAPEGFTASDNAEKTAASQDYEEYVRDYEKLQKKYPRAVPKKPLSKEEWEKSLGKTEKTASVPNTVEAWLAWEG